MIQQVSYRIQNTFYRYRTVQSVRRYCTGIFVFRINFSFSVQVFFSSSPPFSFSFNSKLKNLKYKSTRTSFIFCPWQIKEYAYHRHAHIKQRFSLIIWSFNFLFPPASPKSQEPQKAISFVCHYSVRSKCALMHMHTGEGRKHSGIHSSTRARTHTSTRTHILNPP